MVELTKKQKEKLIKDYIKAVALNFTLTKGRKRKIKVLWEGIALVSISFEVVDSRVCGVCCEKAKTVYEVVIFEIGQHSYSVKHTDILEEGHEKGCFVNRCLGEEVNHIQGSLTRKLRNYWAMNNAK